MPNHVKKLIINLLNDYNRHIKDALELTGKQRKEKVKEAEEANYLIKNLILEYKK